MVGMGSILARPNLECNAVARRGWHRGNNRLFGLKPLLHDDLPGAGPVGATAMNQRRQTRPVGGKMLGKDSLKGSFIPEGRWSILVSIPYGRQPGPSTMAVRGGLHAQRPYTIGSHPAILTWPRDVKQAGKDTLVQDSSGALPLIISHLQRHWLEAGKGPCAIRRNPEIEF